MLIPDYVINCNDRFCTDHDDVILDYLNDVMDIMISASKLTIPNNIYKTSNDYQSNKLPGWNIYVKQYKENAIKWHNEWRDAGRPTEGLLSDMWRQSRVEYHRDIKFIKPNP